MSVINIPGGKATFYSNEDITPRRKRPIDALNLEMGDLMVRIRNANQIIEPDGTVGTKLDKDNPSLGLQLTRHEVGLLLEMNETAAWAFLKSWTLDRPLPASPDEVLDLPVDLYDALVEHAAKLIAGTFTDQFEVSEKTLEDEGSPTGA